MKEIKSISLDKSDLDYLAQVAKEFGLDGLTPTIRFIVNAFRKEQELIKNGK
jgi:hypothetical protein